MPIISKEHEWSQSDETIQLTVPLKGVHSSKVDIYTNSLYLKINFPPFLFQLDLLNEINPEKSTCTVGNGCAVFLLEKADKNITWNELSYSGIENEEIICRRKAAETKEFENIKQRQLSLQLEKRKQENLLVQKQIEVERNTRERVEAQKKLEKEEALESVNSWQKTLSQNELKMEIENIETKADIKANRIDSGVFSSDSESDSELDMAAVLEKVSKQKQKERPPPRQSTEIKITFTSRGLLPTTTARETEDAKWQVKIKQMLEINERKKKLDDNSLEDEKNPEFLKEKGNQFFKNENYEAALNAFTAALNLDSSNYGYLTSRAACFLKCDNPSDASKDCINALALISGEEELLKQQLIEFDPKELEARRIIKVKTWLRKGYASVSMGNLKEGLKDFKNALALDPNNEEIKSNVNGIESKIKIEV